MRESSSFKSPRALEYPEYFRPGMGTEHVGLFLRSLIQMVRPKRVLEVGAGYTTPFLLEGLVNNRQVIDDGNLKDEYFLDYKYEPRFVILDDMSLGDLKKRPGMRGLLDSSYVDFIPGDFRTQYSFLKENYGTFDFVWFDCGGVKEYRDFFKEYWDICSHYVICHFTYSNGQANSHLEAILKNITGSYKRLDIIEPHKIKQGSLTIFQKY